MAVELINVFISYAHESENFKEDVRQFAIWLNTNGQTKVLVTTDHLHAYKAPKEGWQVWMRKQITNSEIVLIICTEKYLKRFTKDEEPEQGKGVIYEGSIITTTLYNAQMVNEKFIPILPDDGNPGHVPLDLQPFFNNLRFSKNNEQILKAILNENPTLHGGGKLIHKQINNQELALENQIVDVIINSNNIQMDTTTFSSIHALVRSFLELSDFQKIGIAKKLGVFEDKLNRIPPDERDKLVLKNVNDLKLIEHLWNEVNNLKPFNLKINPFKNK